jgi:cell division protease FtsH
MCAALGGRAAEEVAFGKISTGALSDLEKVTKQAYAMVTIYGLNEKIGNRSYYDSSGESQFQKPYSDATACIIDEETSKIIEGAYLKAKELLSSHREQLDKLAAKLLEKEVIFKDDLEEVLGIRPWGEEPKADKTIEMKSDILPETTDESPTAEPTEDSSATEMGGANE